MTKKRTAATPATKTEKPLEVKELAFQHKPEESSLDQATAAIKDMLCASKWDAHMTQISISINNSRNAFTRFRLLAKLAKGGYDGDLCNGGSGVIHTLNMGKAIIEKGGLLIGVAEENGEDSEDLIWIPKAPAMDRELVETILNPALDIKITTQHLGLDRLSRYTLTNKESIAVLGITTRGNIIKTHTIVGILGGQPPVDVISIDKAQFA